MVSVPLCARHSFTVEVWRIVLVEVLSWTLQAHAPILLSTAIVEVCVGAELVAASQNIRIVFVKKVCRASDCGAQSLVHTTITIVCGGTISVLTK